MRAIFTLLVLIMLHTASAQTTSHANRFIVIDLPLPVQSVSQDADNLYLLEQPTHPDYGIHVIGKFTGQITHYPFPTDQPIADFQTDQSGQFYYTIPQQGLYTYDLHTRTSELVWSDIRPSQHYRITFSPDKQYILLWDQDHVLLSTDNYTQITRFENPITLKSIVDDQGRIWNMDLYAIHLYDPTQNTPVTYSADKLNKQRHLTFEPSELRDLRLSPDKQLYVIAGNNLYVHTPDSTQWLKISTYTPTKAEIPNNLLIGSQGNYYLTFRNSEKGILLLGKNIPTHITAHGSIPTTHITDPAFRGHVSYPVQTDGKAGTDLYGNLWILSKDSHRLIIYTPNQPYFYPSLMGRQIALAPPATI